MRQFDYAVIKMFEDMARAVCRCSIAEKQSGHHVDCWTPTLQDRVTELAVELEIENRSSTRKEAP